MTEVEKRLLLILADLGETEQRSLLDFAEFLASRAGAVRALPAPRTREPAQPDLLPRPEQETVVGAIKRLRQSYPMLDRRKLLNETSAAMSKHAIGGVKAEIVIDELEEVFARHYTLYCETFYSASDA
ncbi:MAG: hypothetical protein ACOY5C_08545 [Pseudomonadota bacterium]|uniref:hypothetical protein n=1 Tax=Thermithiobacillus tepidarius TaxID=929 RepID=UPI0004090965|nr:hypothetical protein [Thermithiobacillus tepidarius]